MSDRVKGFVITLENDVKLEDCELLMQTIRYMELNEYRVTTVLKPATPRV